MNIPFKLLILPTFIMTVGVNSAHAHAIEGVGTGLLHLVSSMDHILVLLMSALFGSVAILKGIKVCRALHDGRD